MWIEGTKVVERERSGDREPVFDLPLPLTAIAVALLAIHLVRGLLSAQADDLVVALFAFIPDRFLFDAGVPAYPGGWGAVAWSFVTYAALHGSWMHVGINTVMLAAAGRPLLFRLGTGRFLALTTAAAVGGAACHLAVDFGSPAPMIGASGVVFGLFGALMRFVFAPPFRPLPSAIGALAIPRVRGFVFALVVMNVVLVLVGSAPFGGDAAPVAWGAHLGGFLAGFLGFRLFDRSERRI